MELSKGRISPYRRPLGANSKSQLNSPQTLYSSNQQNQVCFSGKCIFARSISKHQVSISLMLPLPFRDLFAAYLEAMAWKVYCGES